MSNLTQYQAPKCGITWRFYRSVCQLLHEINVLMEWISDISLLLRVANEIIPHPMSQDTVSQEHCPSRPQPPRLLDQVRAAIRRLNYSRRTEEAYVHWIKRYIYFHGKRHPNDLGEGEAIAFLSHLATERKVAAATQGQALAALLFLYNFV